MESAAIKNDLPQISIIIVTFNAAAFLQACLNSIYQQKYPNIEVVVVDGASTDNTVDILKKNTAKIDFWKSEKDSGIYEAMNKALQHTAGKWIYFLGADDLLFEGFSEMAYRLKDNNTIYYGNVVMSGKKTGPVTSTYSLAKKNICHQAVIYPSSVFKKYTFETKYITDADHLLNMQLWNDSDYHFNYIDITIANYNDTGASSTQTDTAFEQDRPALIFKYFGFGAWARYIFRRFKVNLSAKKHQRLQ